ncbi:MAG: N-acetylmuramoyl-L-alanine amidase [Eubacteriales bacterium]|nr:N-acetylmuramoyl-L-alanine amidase [Eubacteriales bacterium]
MEINKLLTPYNHNASNVNRIKYIVIHYVGAIGSARANCQWYAGGNRGASAHYFVDFDGSIWQSVEDKDIAWHCGAASYRHPECRNANSIGIEMCVRNDGNKTDTSHDWRFEDATVLATIQLTKKLMEQYHVSADRVIRHYDVTGKICPNPYVYNTGNHTWDEFKAALENKSGWWMESDGWRFYLGNGEPVRNDWYCSDGGWYWFDGAGRMVTDTWYQYKEHWYYLGSDGRMEKGLQDINGKWYYLDQEGRMSMNPVVLTPDKDGALQYPGLAQ